MVGASGPAKPAWRVPRMGRCLGMVPLAGRNTPCRRSENTIGCSIACRPCQPQSTQRRKVAYFLNGWSWALAHGRPPHPRVTIHCSWRRPRVPNLKSQNVSQDMAICQLKPQDVALLGDAAQQCSSLGAGSLCLGNVLAVSGSYFWVPVTQGWPPGASRLTPPDTLKWGSHCASGRLWRGRSGAQPP